MLKINNITVKSPKTMEVTINDLDGESGRNANGDLLRDRIGVKRNIRCEWGALTQAEISTILNAINGVFFNVEYMDPQLGVTTKNFYTGNRSSPVLINKGGSYIWENLNCNFIER